MKGTYNLSFAPDNEGELENGKEDTEPKAIDEEKQEDHDGQRGAWGRDIEFLFSCISLSVGLGNIWRFPYVALGS